MKIDFTTVLTDQDNKPIQDIIAMQNDDSSPENLTLGRACFNSLLVQRQNELDLSGDEKFQRGKLAFKIRTSSNLDVNLEDIDLIKKHLGYLYSPIVIYRAYLLLGETDE